MKSSVRYRRQSVSRDFVNLNTILCDGDTATTVSLHKVPEVRKGGSGGGKKRKKREHQQAQQAQ